MKNLLLASASLLILSAVPAMAADAVEGGTYEAPVAFDWTGGYIGVRGGGGWSDIDWFYDGSAISTDHNGNGGFVGGRAGFNYQFPNSLVFGAELEANWADIDGATPCPNPAFSCGENIKAFGSLNARLGYAVDRWLFSVNGGVAAARVDFATDPFFGTGFKDTFVGWTLGAGIEYAFTDNIIFDIGYKYYDFGDKTAPAGALDFSGADLGVKLSTLNVGVSYKF